MYSAEGDTVLDPFTGLGTTNLAAIASNRNSMGIDIDKDISSLAIDNIKANMDALNSVIDRRIANHRKFIQSLPEDKRRRCYVNGPHGFLVKTRQETSIILLYHRRLCSCEFTEKFSYTQYYNGQRKIYCYTSFFRMICMDILIDSR